MLPSDWEPQPERDPRVQLPDDHDLREPVEGLVLAIEEHTPLKVRGAMVKEWIPSDLVYVACVDSNGFDVSFGVYVTALLQRPAYELAQNGWARVARNPFRTEGL